MARSIFVLVCVLSPLVAQAAGNEWLSRAAVGVSVPDGFGRRSVVSARDAADYVENYIRALALERVHVERVLGLDGRFLVYAKEADSGRRAFAVRVTGDGEIGVKRFPSMAPEMMWNLKYGHRARRRGADIEMDLALEEARRRAREAIAESASVNLGGAEIYPGYYLFGIRENTRLVGEVAVNGMNGETVWSLFSRPVVEVLIRPKAER